MTFKQFFQRLLPSPIKNIIYQTPPPVREVSPKIKKGKSNPPSNYKIVFEDDFSTRFLDKTKWVPSQPWGEYNPSTPNEWWPQDETALSLSNNTLNLELRYFPKNFGNPVGFEIKHAAGLVRTKKQFKFGWFEADIKFPKGNNQFAHFGLQSYENPNTQINIFDAFTNPDQEEKFETYACHWTEEFVHFYINGYLVKSITDKETINSLNKSSQYLVLNNGLKDEPKDFKYYSVMEVKNVKIYQNEGTPLS